MISLIFYSFIIRINRSKAIDFMVLSLSLVKKIPLINQKFILNDFTQDLYPY